MRAATLFLTSCLALSPVLAQTAGEALPAPQPESSAEAVTGSRHNQRIERIRVEDGGSRVDELRVGGETKSITVQPKIPFVPAYDVQPASEGTAGSAGRRTWKALQF